VAAVRGVSTQAMAVQASPPPLCPRSTHKGMLGMLTSQIDISP
jgi:hypothetical protein